MDSSLGVTQSATLLLEPREHAAIHMETGDILKCPSLIDSSLIPIVETRELILGPTSPDYSIKLRRMWNEMNDSPGTIVECSVSSFRLVKI